MDARVNAADDPSMRKKFGKHWSSLRRAGYTLSFARPFYSINIILIGRLPDDSPVVILYHS